MHLPAWPHPFHARKRRSHPPLSSPSHHSERQPPIEYRPPYSHVSVADFVDVPSQRFAERALSPTDNVKRPPSYDLFRAKQAARNNQKHSQTPSAVVTNPRHFGALPYVTAHPDNTGSTSDSASDSLDSTVYYIDNNSHVSALLAIINSATQPNHRHSLPNIPPSFQQSCTPHQSNISTSDKSVSSRPTDEPPSDETDLYEGHLEHARFQDASDDDHQLRSKERISERDEVSSTSITNFEPYSQSTHPLHNSQPLAAERRLRYSHLGHATSASSLLSDSSIRPASLSDVCTVRSVESSDGIFRAHSRCSSPLITPVESFYSVHEAFQKSRNLMCQNPVSPTKYTFKPPQTPSSPSVSPAHSRHTVPLFTAERHTEPISPKLSTPQVCQRKSYSFSSLSSHANSEPLTLAAIKKAVDIIDPRVVFSIAQSPSLAFATSGLFRKKRDSDETINSTSTEYYEDEYTRFIEKRHSLSPSRLIHHPKISMMMGHESWSLRGSKQKESESTLSIPESDDDYCPDGC
ncbi:hypothetical protein BWQ96_00075 [Gracilariopsis chorda]|uniref:Uncharacterized protein n=1 Tax=Gracilariopsis chorda TaxID=448386 RepID=A0A2V3J675_9FLOR|nr:hypothetical protein BWQ96_00075 [Gracilariopsis chorda]|eukprot:PXF49915.1 hypothetical protein BWQ96_00075 [Gracilariopsis chorda]